MMNRVLIALAAAAVALAPMAALAGPSEQAFLARLPGTWTGSGKLTGAETGNVSCVLNMTLRSTGTHFASKCDVEGAPQQSFAGTLSYNEKEGRYEAKSSGGEVVVGTRKGSSVVFESRMRGLATGTSVLTISSNRITVDTTVRRSASSGDIKSFVEMRR